MFLSDVCVMSFIGNNIRNNAAQATEKPVFSFFCQIQAFIIRYRANHIFNASSTSFLNGIDCTAPFLVTAIDEAFALILSTSGIAMPSIIPARKYPVNVSPAAVVSTA